MKKEASVVKTYNTDLFMRKLYESLVRDFRTVAGQEYKAREIAALRRSISEFRGLSQPVRLQAPPWLFKMEAQLEGLFKRYRFETDVYTDDELEVITMLKYKILQERLATLDWVPTLSASTFRVVQGARRIVKEALSPFDTSAIGDQCRFSTRASVGNPARDAYLDHKLADPLSGSREHIEWFKTHFSVSGSLERTLRQCQPLGEPSYRLCNSLPLVGVPKSWKSLRLISPNTLLGGYYTFGLGKVFVDCLESLGLCLPKLQTEHRMYAKTASKSRSLVTADLSAASECFRWTTMARLLPRKWLKALDFGRIRYFTPAVTDHCEYPRPTYNAGFMAMGIGYTFPVQTLLFYALIKSVCNLVGDTGLVSVYGDDLIYPRRVHRYVARVLQDLGFSLNMDKTFVESNFRESCGGDYYHGVDVRPFSPEGACQNMRASKYEAWLYQLVNGLRERWTEWEIPITLRLLSLELLRVTYLIKQVPQSFPDYAGWRTRKIETDPLSGFEPVRNRFQNGSRGYWFKHLVQTPQHRYVSFQEPYLYDALRAADANEVESEARSIYETKRDALVWLKHPYQPKRYRSISKRRLTRQIAATPCKLVPMKTSTTRTGPVSDWI